MTAVAEALVVTVFGKPVTQGSKTRTKWGIRDDNADRLRPWREAVKQAALDAVAGAVRLEGPVSVEVVFSFDRPKSAPVSVGRCSLMAPVRRPVRATLTPSTARLLVLFLEVDKAGFASWMSAARRRLPLEDQLALDEDPANLGFIANWQRDWSASDVGQPKRPLTDVPRRLEHDEITTGEAADMLRVSDRHVRRLLDGGALKGRRVNARQLMVSRSSVVAYRQAVA